MLSAHSSKTSRLWTSDGADVVHSTANHGLAAQLGPGNCDKTAPVTCMNLEACLDDEDVLTFVDGLDALFDIFRKTPSDYSSAQ